MEALNAAHTVGAALGDARQFDGLLADPRVIRDQALPLLGHRRPGHVSFTILPW